MLPTGDRSQTNPSVSNRPLCSGNRDNMMMPQEQITAPRPKLRLNSQRGTCCPCRALCFPWLSGVHFGLRFKVQPDGCFLLGRNHATYHTLLRQGKFSSRCFRDSVQSGLTRDLSSLQSFPTKAWRHWGGAEQSTYWPACPTQLSLNQSLTHSCGK